MTTPNNEYKFDTELWEIMQFPYMLLGLPGGRFFLSVCAACGVDHRKIKRPLRRYVMEVASFAARLVHEINKRPRRDSKTPRFHAGGVHRSKDPLEFIERVAHAQLFSK